MKKLITLTLSAFMVFQSTGVASTPAENLDLGTQVEQMKIEDLSADELKAALGEIKDKLTMLKEDLELAEKQDGDRLAIKVRNGIAITSAALVVATILLTKRNDPGPKITMAGISGIILFGGLGIAAVTVTQGYIYVTRDEIRDLKKTIRALENKITKIEDKIELRQTQTQ